MQRRAQQSHQSAHVQQGKPDLPRSQESKPNRPGKNTKQGRAQSHARQREAGTFAIDQPASRDHEHGIYKQKHGVDLPHPLRRNPELLHDPLIAGAGNAGSIEVADEAKRHQEPEYQPAPSRGS